MEKQYVDRADEWVKWYMYNRKTTMSIEHKVEFQEKAIHGLFEMLVRTINELERIEEGHNRPKILLPSGINFEEPLHV